MNPATSSRDPSAGLLNRLGVGRAEAVRALRTLGAWSADGPGDTAEATVAAITASPNPDIALRTLERVAEHHGSRVLRDFELLRRAAVVSASSEALGEWLVARHSALTVLGGELGPDSADDVRVRCGQALAESRDPAHTLATVQRLGLLRIAARDLLGYAGTPAAAAELAELAAGLLAGALDHVVTDEARVAVIGMGKLGGQELNYLSDVDVIFVHEGDHQAATAIAERLIRVVGSSSPVGRAYEIDTSLRPEGRDGPLTRSLDAYRTYYDRWAQTWEYQALLKARPVAGDPELGAAFLEMAEPYVWPDRRAASSVDEIQAMKEAVEASGAVRKAGAREVKLAPGGIRDIEFAVQLLQLVHGRHEPMLRSAHTLEALAALAKGGYVDDGDASLFDDAYQFLRTVEHRLQLRRLRRTHVVPEDPAEREVIARSCGFRDLTSRSALEQFDREYARVRSYVRRLHEKLFFRPLLARFAELSAAEQLPLPGRVEGLGESAASDRLAALGFSDASQALADLDALAGGVSRRARLMRTLLPAVMPVLSQAPDPNGGLSSFRALTERLGATPAYLRTLRDNPPVGETLARVLGASRLVGEWLAREPELIPQLGEDALAEAGTAQAYARAAQGLLRRGEDPARTANALRRLKRREVARIAVRDLIGLTDVTSVGAELSGLADACLDAGLTLVTGALPVRFAVLGMGNLGGQELNYASDLDVILVFEPSELRTEALGAVDQLVGTLADITAEGQAFRVDLGLRPEGRDGPVARTYDSTLAYYRQWAHTWELQALTRARVVAGDRELGKRLLAALEPLIYPERVGTERLQAIRQMKARVERERTSGRARNAPRLRRPRAQRPEGDDGGVHRGDRIDLKLGPGGLSDVDWTAQLLQIQHGAQHPALRTPGTLAALEAAVDEGVLGPRDARWLRDGWCLLTRLRNAMYLRGGRDTAALPAGASERDRLARTIGYRAPAGQALTEDVGRVTRRVRRVHERVFYDG